MQKRVSGPLKFFVVFLVLLLPCGAFAVRTALDEYVEKPDPSYSWSLYQTQPYYGLGGGGPALGTLYTLRMTSQTWRSASEVNRTQWNHWVQFCVPNTPTPNLCLLIIDGGSLSGTWGTPSNVSDFAFAANILGCCLAYLQFIPNQPLRFSDESINRSEDAIISYTFDKFLDRHEAGTPDPEWPALLPMVKASVRAMDTITAAAAQHAGKTIDRFIVGGASKRGWTTWLTAAVDPRVVGAVPIVIDILNMRKQMPHHKNAYSSYPPDSTTYNMYGGYSTAVHDYTGFGIFDRLDTPAGRELAAIVDPFTYRDRLTMPKMIINSTGDQFFLPDGIKFYWDYLPETKYVMYLPNTDHSLNIDLSNLDVVLNLVGFLRAFIPGSGVTFPAFHWTFEPDGSIRVQPGTTPDEVLLWQAHNPNHRDFRLQNVGAIWSSTPLTDPDGDGVYVASVPQPAQGWTGFFVQASVGGLLLCSGLRVIPDTYYNGAPAPDVTAPVLTLNSVTPARVRPGDPANLVVLASEPLLDAPEVTMDHAGVVLTSGDGQTWHYAVSVDVSAPEGPLSARATALDQAENPGEAQFNDVLTVDATPPSIVSLSAIPALARPGDRVTFNLTASEPLADPPTVTVETWPAVLVSPGKADTDLVYQWTVPETMPPGGVTLTVVMTDEAGNTATVTRSDILEIGAPLPLRSGYLAGLLILLCAVAALYGFGKRECALSRPGQDA